MSNSIRVTVVATGLGQPLQVVKAPPEVKVVTNARAAVGGGERPNYANFDTPTGIRQQAVGDDSMPPAEPSFELLDIPAFLRRQAD
jgi:hypothetical protein